MRIRAFYDKRLSQEVSGDALSEEFKGTSSRSWEGATSKWTRKEDWREEEKVSVRGCIVSQDLSVLKTIVFLFIA
ncbi:hypothetical protein Bca52824_075154 [Brassica carinata]|uniref:Uncharacterized protein n=1 Tax=Brassica carinata TaxID=52824 RepID=A0A8X7PQL6_BRACI|nr:hypothetical protein Bca52824_075154 [Brassica carinata]